MSNSTSLREIVLFLACGIIYFLSCASVANGEGEEEDFIFLSSDDQLIASDNEAEDQFGYSVSTSGGYAIIGALYNEDDSNNKTSGSAYIFELGESSTEIQKLVASDGEEDDRFGAERDGVAISGNYAIIGAYKDDDFGENSGSAYIFERSSSGDGVWSEKQKLLASDTTRDRRFGTCVDIDGDYAIVGASANAPGGSFEAGAYIYERSSLDGSDGVWNETAILRVENITASERFGTTVSISGNYAIVGAEHDENGSAFIFERSNDDGVWNLTAKLVASDGISGDSFGRSVSIYNDLAIVGAYLTDNGGSAYVFERQPDGTWSEMDKLVANDGAAGDAFGQDVSINDNYAIVGATNDFFGTVRSGSAYIFQRDSGSDSWIEMAKLLPRNATQNGRFGHSISMSEDNDIVVGEYGNEAAYFYKISSEVSTPKPSTPSTTNEDEGSRLCVSFVLLVVLWLQYVM